MDDQHRMRASDADRQQVVERLRASLADGRLKMDEYVERMGLAYEAVTYGDLAALQTDLPAVPAARPEPAPRAAAPREPVSERGAFARLPTALKVFWTIWLTIVSTNVVVWALVSGTTGQFIYPWPVWVAGPSGAALLAISIGATQIRRNRRAAPGLQNPVGHPGISAPGHPAFPGFDRGVPGQQSGHLAFPGYDPGVPGQAFSAIRESPTTGPSRGTSRPGPQPAPGPGPGPEPGPGP